jgi:hypothetical protein
VVNSHLVISLGVLSGNVESGLNGWFSHLERSLGVSATGFVAISVGVGLGLILLLLGVQRLLERRALRIAHAGVFHSDDPFAGVGHGRKGRKRRTAIAADLDARRHEVPASDPWMAEEPDGAPAAARYVGALPAFVTTEAAPPAGWYPEDPGVPGALRYWDGSAWSEHRAVAGA